MHRLFSYGTLRQESVQRAVFGEPLPSDADAIVGYRLISNTISASRSIAVSGTAEHTIIEPTGDDNDEIAGIVFHLSDHQLQRADAYEDVTYKRTSVRLRSGLDAWVYVKA